MKIMYFIILKFNIKLCLTNKLLLFLKDNIMNIFKFLNY